MKTSIKLAYTILAGAVLVTLTDITPKALSSMSPAQSEDKQLVSTRHCFPTLHTTGRLDSLPIRTAMDLKTSPDYLHTMTSVMPAGKVTDTNTATAYWVASTSFQCTPTFTKMVSQSLPSQAQSRPPGNAYGWDNERNPHYVEPVVNTPVLDVCPTLLSAPHLCVNY